MSQVHRPTDEERLERARKRVAELKSFYGHLFAYVVVMIVLVIIDWQDWGNWWFYWPVMGWGVAVAFHAVGTFGAFGIFGRAWEERKIRELLEKDPEGLKEP